MRYFVIAALLLLAGCGKWKTADEADQANGSTTTTPILSNYSTHTVITGNIATADKLVGTFISSVPDAGFSTFTTTTSLGTFTTATALSVPVGISVIYEKVTDISTSLVIEQVLRAGSSTVQVIEILSLH
jgi:hypothetical protein